jgi:hypothetical protein
MRKTFLFFLIIIAFTIPMIQADPDQYELDIARGLIDGIETWGMIGHTEDSQTSETTLWGLNTRYVFPPIASSMTVSSTDVNDDLGDTGAWMIVIQGLDVNYNELEEVVILNGQTPVNTTNLFFRINYAQILSSGSTGINEGDIYIGTGAVVGGIPANKYALIEADYGNVMQAVYTVPANKTLYLTRIWLTTYTNKQFQVYGIAWSAPSGNNMTHFRKFEAHLGESSLERYINPPIAIPATASIEYTELSDQAGGQINIELIGVLVNEADALSLMSWGIEWLTGILWIALTGIGVFKKSGTMTVFAGFLGLILGLLMMSTSTMVAISLILLNLYLIYTGSD